MRRQRPQSNVIVETMEELVTYIVKAIVAQPDEVTITTTRADDAVTFAITAADEDVGKIIGKDGRTIKAIRTLLRIPQESQGSWVNLEVSPKA